MGLRRRVLIYAASFASALFLSSFAPPSASADLYQWTDKDGTVHLVDDLNKVPEKSRGKARVFKSAGGPAREEVAPVEAPSAQPAANSKAAEFYGEHTLEWWKENFRLKRQALQELDGSYTSKRQFVEVFEGGRRLGQIFGKAEVGTYEKYKKDMPEDEKKIKALKDDLDAFRRQAVSDGVPKEIRGE